jgi:hypothetical protein
MSHLHTRLPDRSVRKDALAGAVGWQTLRRSPNGIALPSIVADIKYCRQKAAMEQEQLAFLYDRERGRELSRRRTRNQGCFHLRFWFKLDKVGAWLNSW